MSITVIIALIFVLGLALIMIFGVSYKRKGLKVALIATGIALLVLFILLAIAVFAIVVVATS